MIEKMILLKWQKNKYFPELNEKVEIKKEKNIEKIIIFIFLIGVILFAFFLCLIIY